MTNFDMYKLKSVEIKTYEGKLTKEKKANVESYSEEQKNKYDKLINDKHNYVTYKGDRIYIYQNPKNIKEEAIQDKCTCILFDYRKKAKEEDNTFINVVKINRSDDEDVYEFEVSSKVLSYENGNNITLIRRVDANDSYYMIEISAIIDYEYY